MKFLLVLCLVAVACTAPQQRGDVQILQYYNDNNGLGNYRWGFQQSDGTRHEQEGELKNAGRENEALAVKGSYSWVGPNGVLYYVTYIADENGFQPTVGQEQGGLSPVQGGGLSDGLNGGTGDILGAGVPQAVVASLLGG